MTRKTTYGIVVGLVFDLLWRLWHILGYISYPQMPSPIALVIGALLGGSLLRATKFFEERSTKRLLYVLGSAALLYTFASAVDYFKIEMLRWPLLILCLGVDILGLWVCIAHLREPEKKQTSIAPQTYIRSYNVSSQFGFALGLVVAAIPLLIGSLPLGRESNHLISSAALRVSGLGLLLLGCVMEFLASSRRWKLALAVGLGLPAAVLIRFALIALTDGLAVDLMLIMIITTVMSVLLGPFSAFAGVILGFTIKGFLKWN